MANNIRLFLVPTPVGNLQDMTYRAVEVLKEVDFILAEDTRTSGKLLKHYEIETPMKAFHAHNEHRQLDRYMELMKEGHVLALITDAGTPAISDPGFLLVREAISQGFEVSTLPGATAVIPALVNSGFPLDRFTYEGFLPHKKGRQKKLKILVEEDRTIVLYESPHRLLKLLKELVEYMPERSVCVCREISKLFEESKRGLPSELLAYFEEKGVKGEIVVVISAIE